MVYATAAACTFLWFDLCRNVYYFHNFVNKQFGWCGVCCFN